ncbi:hypothetical protein P6144_03325 [Sphingomonas sp. HITSZ_GF]|uniref:hypothetical protein n=1 Tax=Sphingomonas sp. HITSZ_GF TaxID=3037247 RepID=UPI00240D350A|nr:hypothetical protein [Sphingomonas sp. HITSZ_GF]MDG2532665.1 hypothetical protein [Sphingomonas sp. HITSZ_GF]
MEARARLVHIMVNGSKHFVDETERFIGGSELGVIMANIRQARKPDKVSVTYQQSTTLF